MSKKNLTLKDTQAMQGLEINLKHTTSATHQGYFMLNIMHQEINLASDPAEFIIRKGMRELG